MNLVSREKAIDVAIDEYNRGYKEGLKDASAKWIPCSERLPERLIIDTYKDGDEYEEYINSGNQLVQTIDGEILIGNLTGYEDEKTVWWEDENCDSLSVVAWMPLPEPYKGE